MTMSVHTLTVREGGDPSRSSSMQLTWNESILLEGVLRSAQLNRVFRENSHIIEWLEKIKAHNQLLKLADRVPEDITHDELVEQYS